MFPQVNALPCTGRELSGPDRHGYFALRQYRSDMCRHIVRTFGDMSKIRITINHEPLHVAFEISQYRWVRILTNEQ